MPPPTLNSEEPVLPCVRDRWTKGRMPFSVLWGNVCSQTFASVVSVGGICFHTGKCHEIIVARSRHSTNNIG